VSEVGSVAEEAALLADALRERYGTTSSGADGADADDPHPGAAAHVATGSTCTGCPVCRANAALQSSAPELTAALGEAVVAVRGLVRAVRTAYAQPPGTSSGARERDAPRGSGSTSDEGQNAWG
jgi:hypothetical protein